MLRCTIGVMAYNEEHNIAQVLRALLNQKTSAVAIGEIIVVASGCTDRTVEFAEALAHEHSLIRVEIQATRAGKASAINRLIAIAREPLIVMAGAGTLPDPHAVEQLVRPFADTQVGMTGARIVPLNDPRTFLGFTIHILWRVHHRMAQRWPKLGELVAFRNIVKTLPTNSATDEVALEALISQQGYQLVYAPDAVVYNRGPQNLPDFLQQRRRIFAGHLHIAATLGYVAASMRPTHLLVLAAEAFVRYNFLLLLLIGAVMLEVAARALGALDFMLGQQHHIWRRIASTKQVQATAQPITLVILRCRFGTVEPSHLARGMRHIPLTQGLIFWWSQSRNQILFSVPMDDPTPAALRARVQTLVAYLGTQGLGGDIVEGYEVIQYSPATALTYSAEFNAA